MTTLPPLPAQLAQALADKGYDALTPVQAAMLDPDLAGRDLLVSAQTGSGKTVAFGLAMAGQLVRAAFEHARQAGLTVVPRCSYAAEWSARHPEYADIVAR